MAASDGAPTDILVGFDETDRGGDALRLAGLLARTTGARLRVARVYPAPPELGLERAAEALSDEVGSTLGSEDPGGAVETVPLVGRSPARALHELAEAEGVGFVVLGSTHRAGIGRVTPGGVAERLLAGAPCPVAVAPRGYEPLDLRVIAVGFDGSREASTALSVAAALGEAAAATLRVIAVRRLPVTSGAAHAAVMSAAPGSPDLQERLHSAVSALPPELRALPIVERGEPARLLLERAEEGVDLMVLGSRGYGPVRAVLVGSVSATVLGAAPCPVLVTPRSAAGG